MNWITPLTSFPETVFPTAVIVAPPNSAFDPPLWIVKDWPKTNWARTVGWPRLQIARTGLRTACEKVIVWVPVLAPPKI